MSPECRHSQGFRKDIHLGAGLASASRLGGSGPEGHLDGDPPETAGSLDSPVLSKNKMCK